MSNVIKCRETNVEDTYDLSLRSKQFSNNWVYYVLLSITLCCFYMAYGKLLHSNQYIHM